MKRLLLSQVCMFLLNLTVATVLYSAGDAGDPGVAQSKSLDPSYAPLEEGAGKYRAKVYDDASVVDLCEISFFGHTTVGGVRKESDDSMNKLDLAFIKEIIIKKPDYTSQRYADKTFSLADIIADTGVKIEDMLLPKHIIICGKENNTHIQKSWFLNKVSRVTIEQPAEKEGGVPKDYVEKIFKKKERVKSKTVKSKEKEDRPKSDQKSDIISEKAAQEAFAEVKKDVDEVKRQTAEIKKIAEAATREVAGVKAEVKEKESKQEEQKEIITSKEEQKAIKPMETREQPAVSGHVSVKDAFVGLVRSFIDFGKSIVNFVLQLLPV